MATKNLKASSAKYGPCEICGKHASEVHIRAIGKLNHAFGHANCLQGDGKQLLELVKFFRKQHHATKNLKASSAKCQKPPRQSVFT